jgi:4-amino-4-deoxy-L-arabinose transferase-like glycosyltransferase
MRTRTILATVLVASLGLRLWGSGFGLPAFTHYHPDEHALVDRATAILQTGDWSPERFNYPPLYAYLQVGGLAISFLLGRAIGWWAEMPTYPLPHYFQLARATTALFGALTVLGVYLAGRLCFGIRAGLLAAALLGGNYLHIIHSHYATLDVAAGFWAVLCLFFSLAWWQRGGAGRGILAGLCAGLAAATKYNAALVAVVPLVVPLLAHPSGRGLAQLALPAGGLALGFLGGNPFALLRWDDFLAGVSSVLRHYGTAQPGFEGLGNWRWYLGTLFTSADAPIVGACLAGLLALVVRKPRHGLLLLVFPVAYFWLISSFVVRFERNLIPILPFLVLAGGWFLDTVAAHLRPSHSRAMVLASTLAALALPLAATVAFDFQLSTPDHREAAGHWLDENAEPGARIAIEHYAIPFDHAPYEVTDVVRVTDYDLTWYQHSGYDLLVVSDGVWEVLRCQSRYYGDRLAAYDRLVAGATLLAEFVPDPPGIVVAGYPSVSVFHFAPVRIYRLSEGG